MDEDINSKLAKLHKLSAAYRSGHSRGSSTKNSKQVVRKQINLQLKINTDRNRLKSYTSSVPMKNESNPKRGNSTTGQTSVNRSSSKNRLKRRGGQSNLLEGASSHRSKKSSLMKTSTVEGVKENS
jgi:hypothetical protein